MSNQNVYLPLLSQAALPSGARPPLGQFLVEMGAITPGHLIAALHQQRQLSVRLGDILVAEGWARPADIRTALAQQLGLAQVDLLRSPPDLSLTAALPPRFWLRQGLLPWARVGPQTLIATSDLVSFTRHRALLVQRFGAVLPVLADPAQIQSAVALGFPTQLAEAASTRVAADHSCRDWTPGSRLSVAAATLSLIALLVLAPQVSLGLACAVALLTLALFLSLRLSSALAHLPAHRLRRQPPLPRPIPWANPLPPVSVMVPLYRETEIAGALLHRLSRLTYPKPLLEVLLVLEEHDTTTRRALTRAVLPPWMRIVEVPAHRGLTTKPRALNYALDFCRGEVIGVWDAEDAPDPDQIERVVRRFSEAPARVACLQGILDFYNPRTNWRARCFTIEYAAWFRVILPGMVRLGLIPPLGGTTHFFRRAALEDLGGWDAHNVTEDADLGVRLYRAGYRTEMIDAITHEEATCRPWPWVRQRSRWLKGFMITYLVHMRQPRRLWSDLGPLRFLGMQAFFLGTLGQFLLAPALWSLWLLALGLPHPLAPLLPRALLHGALALTLLAELSAMVIGMAAVARPERRFLIGWVPTMTLYFPLGVLAAYKALYELVLRPFYWDKTRHGQASPEGAAKVSGRARASRHPV